MMNCALFIDYENIAISLSQTRLVTLSPGVLARVLRENAEKYGKIKCARAFADWDRFTGAARAFAEQGIDPRFVLQGKNSADVELCLQVQEALKEASASVSTFILVTGDRDFLAIIERLKREDKRVVVWGVEERTSQRLKEAADEFVPLEQLLSGVQPEIEEENEESPLSPTRNLDHTAWTLPALATLILRFDLILYERGWTWIAFKTLTEELADDVTFGSTPNERAWWVNLAISEKILLPEKRPHAKNPEAEITVCFLNSEHPLVKAGISIVPRVIQVLHEQLQTKPWIAYGLLDRILASDPDLNHDGVERRFWINILIHMGAILTEKKENPHFPERPVTGCRLNPSHPLVRRYRPGPRNPDEWLDYHLILLVEHFMVNREVPWMSMGQLRRTLEDRYGTDRMRYAVDKAVVERILLVEHYPNRLHPDRPTTGCHLNREHPLVQKALTNFRALIRLVAGRVQYRPWVPLGDLEKAMAFHREFGETEEERNAWLALLMEPGILLVDKRPDPCDPQFPTIACHLNFADRMVQNALASEGE